MREWLLRLAADLPPTHGALRRLARRRAGRHHLAAIAVLIDGTDVLVAEHAFHGGAWALPGGWVNAREDPFRAVEREVREELGVPVAAVAVVHCERQGRDVAVPKGPSAVTLAFRCRLLTPSRPADLALSGEVRSARWIDLAEAGAYLSPFEQEAIAATRRTISSEPGPPGPP